MKIFLGITVLLLSNLLVFPAWSMDLAPDRLVDKTVKEVIEIIQKDEALKNGDRDKMHDLIETKILPHFNFSRMTQLAMGQHWSKAAPEQQYKLVNEFRTLLVRTYSNALTSYNKETINVNSIKQLGDQVETTVRTVVIQGNGKEPVPIDYSMEKKPDGWKVYDVTVAGVSLVTNYRGTFNSQVRKGGVEGLLKALEDKNKSLVGKK
ncbi:MAG: ABC transporter substrate-binding protein [Nitrosomonas sp.]|uniref:MlaC/ttg2D family ABC transporter substrate-binding protein n=1 Tax=Nitrosomonas sp. TaxID=42353 RepID=UPI0027237AF8|nr:ABC transporter substrate-binding protein [Nitrosomonas sp.]MDO8895105.1 ABC transporter substrate-binding protein [Nitrosomonas sp.]MDO9470766.1 ABC transporter substrate-binding protein [Nitrosomonas sp.]MDP1786203.1 ABC transporter substrate-binding protein [Nitrosomonas sp.]MDP1934971.1 ABC transporter substrate-binding protein [Nitrosomonas sp.]MDP2223637.1 ABC transporter substrate-binding protein [Nitrosomonas sp.]